MILNKEGIMQLGSLKVGETAEIVGFASGDELQSFLIRLYEIGFLEGERVKVLQEAPIGRDPISVLIKDAVYALRREDANLIQVKRVSV